MLQLDQGGGKLVACAVEVLDGFILFAFPRRDKVLSFD
jgi:hypothetical protein